MVFFFGVFLKEKYKIKKKKKGDPTRGVIIHGSASGKSTVLGGLIFDMTSIPH
jgi:translation elongation factor EF-1alpha